eukprot:CAMPEP_0114512272 /NCGR_PEP_ID=MMETSP0109-20121206/14877_1 /TAXON_ID=29199 /ORGANISM="Chlorarachnion reptans, Strain CCCM449" /LENGTH=790 /DNA_ID=CAMNT_0001691925 /DNA_START=180 /DNA_END=2552 /DNA_ORIENTATION=-
MNRVYSWQYLEPGSRTWRFFDSATERQVERAQRKGTDTTWVKHESDQTQMQIVFKKMQCRVKNRRGKWQTGKIRKFDVSNAIKEKTIKMRVGEAKYSADSKSFKNDIIPAEVPPHRTMFRPNGVNGLSMPVTEPIAKVGWRGTFVVRTIRGRSLYNTSTLGTQDVYVGFSVGKHSLDRRRKVGVTPKCVDGGTTPLFNHLLSFPTSIDDQHLVVSAYSKGSLQDSLIGRAKISIPLLITYLNPIAGQFCGQTTSDVEERQEKAAKTGLNKRELGIIPAIHSMVTYDSHRQRVKECGEYALRSWFTLTRDAQTLTYAGELLLDFRFFPSPMSKLIDWTIPIEPTPVVRTGKLFGVHLKDAISRSEYEVPAPITECIEALLEIGLEEEGLFRVPGDAKLIKSYRLKYDKREKVEINGVHELAGVLKLFFREMSDSLFPKMMYQHFLDVEKNGTQLKDRLNKYSYLLTMLPRENSMCLHYLMYFLSCVAKHSEVNKMAPKNLAIVWGPNLLRSPNPNDPQDVFNIPKVTSCVETFIAHFEEIFHKPIVAERDRAIEEAKKDQKMKPKPKRKISHSMDAQILLQQREIESLKAQIQELKEKEAQWSDNQQRMEQALRSATTAVQEAATNVEDGEVRQRMMSSTPRGALLMAIRKKMRTRMKERDDGKVRSSHSSFKGKASPRAGPPPFKRPGATRAKPASTEPDNNPEVEKKDHHNPDGPPSKVEKKDDNNPDMSASKTGKKGRPGGEVVIQEAEIVQAQVRQSQMVSAAEIQILRRRATTIQAVKTAPGPPPK